ncbi:biotin--protein ligase isoform X1 [Danio rerio]|uniref:Biotin--protein ligase isoform X1 n=1 Tax=Danio rerio TaxID=7955 RepID=A0AC58GL70_DANRE
MLITLCYIYLWMRFQRRYASVIRDALRGLSGGHRGFTFRQQSTSSPQSSGDTLLLQLGDRGVFITEPQVCEDLSRWTVLSSSLAPGGGVESVSFLIEASSSSSSSSRAPLSPHRSSTEVGSALTPNTLVLNWSDLCLPLACSPGQPYRAVAETSLENFSRLGVAFMEDRLRMENGLIPAKITSVSLREAALQELIQSQQRRRLSAPQQHPEPQSEHQHMDGHHLHLSSCTECLELENSTILSVRCASVENIPDLPEDCSTEPEQEPGPQCAHGKPPNVLVYTDGCEQQFQKIRSLLAECVDTERYTVYHLQPQQALSEPWLENTLLLVLAPEHPVPLPPPLQLRFLSYLSQGGRLLGLCCSLCPAGLTLRPRAPPHPQLCTLSFTRADSSQLRLSVVSSGSVFERDGGGGGQVELWGQISGQEMAIVRVTHGPDSGEAILCQVRLDSAPAPHHLSGTQSCSELETSDALRYQVLTEILTSLGLSCGRSQVLPHTPIHLLTTHPELKASFVRWLRAQVCVSGGVVRLPECVLKVCWSAQECVEVCDGELVLHTDPPACFSELFSLQTYTHHLQTQRLGRTVLYTDVTSSTMDLLDGVMMDAPQEVGLIAIAARQTQGKGRGGNAWLSPPGCAMFTLHLQLPVSSRLGQRISFLQHLTALAVVEAVRTLPGYEGVELRLKWPNDIYYRDQVKLGGVLIRSSVMGHTFNLRIGCGFNVSNSQPTVCVNDAVRAQGCGLPELTPEQLMGRCVTLLERYIEEFQRSGHTHLLTRYYTHWLHGGSSVRLWSEDGPSARVLGLDDCGFLQVECEDGEVVSLQPDGNSFDMMKNLLLTKTS